MNLIVCVGISYAAYAGKMKSTQLSCTSLTTALLSFPSTICVDAVKCSDVTYCLSNGGPMPCLKPDLYEFILFCTSSSLFQWTEMNIVKTTREHMSAHHASPPPRLIFSSSTFFKGTARNITATLSIGNWYFFTSEQSSSFFLF